MDWRTMDVNTVVGVMVALLVVLATLVATTRKPAAPPLPRGDAIVVLECVQLEEASRTKAAAAAATRWLRCSENFGANIKAVRSVPNARDDASYGAILLIEPLRQFEALGAAVAVPLLEQYLRDLGRCAAGLVEVYGLTGDMRLAKLNAIGWAAPAFELLDAGEAVPPAVRAVANAVSR